VQFACQGEALFPSFARHLSNSTTQRRILLANPLCGVEDLLGLTKHLPSEHKGSQEQEQCPNTTHRNRGGKRESKEPEKKVASQVMKW